MMISGMVKSSLVDYPGLVACVLFVPGCNYNCFYCHNRSLIDGTGDAIDLGEVEAFLRKRTGFLDAVVISGGEPTLQSGLIGYLNMIKQMGYRIKLDTNGSSPRVVSSLLQTGLCDYFAVDYKAPAERYREICGNGSNAEAVRETIEILRENNASFEVRTTVIPQLKREELVLMAKELPPLPRYVLNRYRPPKLFLPADRTRVEQTPYTQAEIEGFAQAMRGNQPNITV